MDEKGGIANAPHLKCRNIFARSFVSLVIGANTAVASAAYQKTQKLIWQRC
jgi:hypothetical protein